MLTPPPFSLCNFPHRALLVYPPSLDFMLAFLGCLKAGVVAVPCFPPNPARKDTLLMFSRIAESSGAKFVLTSSEYNHLKKLAGVKDVFTKFTTARHTAAAWPEQLEWVVTDTATASGKNKSKNNKTLPTPVKKDLAFLQVRIYVATIFFRAYLFFPPVYLTPRPINKISIQAAQRRSQKES